MANQHSELYSRIEDAHHHLTKTACDGCNGAAAVIRDLEEQLETYGSWLQEIVSLHHEGGDGAHVCHYAVLAQKALDGVPFPAEKPS